VSGRGDGAFKDPVVSGQGVLLVLSNLFDGFDNVEVPKVGGFDFDVFCEAVEGYIKVWGGRIVFRLT
jgi:hypothetical protein